MTKSSIFFLFLLLSSCNISQNDNPNIILFFYDDLGYGELGVYGQKVIETNNIDNLANNALKFTNFYFKNHFSDFDHSQTFDFRP